MGDNEVKAIHAHRESNGKLEYLVERTKEEYKGLWKFVEQNELVCSEVLNAYIKKRESLKYWQKILEGAAQSLEKDIALGKTPTDHPAIVDIRPTEKNDSYASLPKIITGKKEEPSYGVKVKTVFAKLVVQDVPHVLCEMDDGKFNWIKIASLNGNKLVEIFYFIEHILNAQMAKGAIELPEAASSSGTKRRKCSSSSSTSESLSEEVLEEIQDDEDLQYSRPVDSDGSLACEFCNKVFATIGKWNDHIRNHSRYECFWCKKHYNWRSLPDHALTKHRKKGRCCVCGVVANRPASCKNRCKGTKGKLVKK